MNEPRQIGKFFRFTTGGNVAIYEGECIGVCPKGKSLYKYFPAFAAWKTTNTGATQSNKQTMRWPTSMISH